MTPAEELATRGAARLTGAAAPLLSALHEVANDLPADRAGIRLSGNNALRRVLDVFVPSLSGRLPGLVGMRPIRAILFDKSAERNWALDWHQDRTIVVREQRKVPGFGPWSVKAGLVHVEPPFAILERMVTVRIHLDPVPSDNAPLLVAAGSHRAGRVPESAICTVVNQCDRLTCLADAGDAWAYSTPILHASEASRSSTGRRVLQVDLSSETLPGSLEWQGV